MNYRITNAADGVTDLYVLLDAKETIVRSDDDPKRLAAWAFDNGAFSVRHEYDLTAAEEASWSRAGKKR